MTKTVLELDLVGYSTIAATLEGGMDVQIIAQLNEQIQDFVDVGLAAVGVKRPKTVMLTTGDGAILVFDQPSQAHDFATAVQEATRTHNADKEPGIGKRVFRVGIATGDLVMQPKTGGGFDIAGMTIARAVRLEAKANPGEVLCDPETFAGLTAGQQALYAKPETIPGKRDETFTARRCVLNPDGVKDAEFFTGPAAGSTRQPVAPQPNPATQTPQVNRKEIFALFPKLRSNDFEKLILILDVPIARRPADTIELERRQLELFKWAEGPPSLLMALLLELRELANPR